MSDRLRFFLSRVSERLWFRPLAMCVLSITTVFLAGTLDNPEIGQLVPTIAQDSIETLLAIISASMLVIATFTVASMVSACWRCGMLRYTMPAWHLPEQKMC